MQPDSPFQHNVSNQLLKIKIHYYKTMYVCCNLWKDLFEIDLLKIKILYLIKIGHNIELTKHTILSHPMMTIDTYIIKSSKYHIVQNTRKFKYTNKDS